MKGNLVFRVAAPALVVGLLLLISSLAGVSYINRLRRNLADILIENVASLRAAQELEICVRQLRFRSLLFLSDPTVERIAPIDTAQRRFEEALDDARHASSSPDEAECVRLIEEGYHLFRSELARLRATAASGKPVGAFHAIADSHPIQAVVDPCQELLRINKQRMDETAQESQRLAQQGNFAMLVLGLVGPVGGLVVGYGMARGLRKSIYKLSVRVQDIAQHFDRDVMTLNVAADGDIHSLDMKMQEIVGQVEEVTARVQRQHNALLRTEQLVAVGQLAAGVAHEIRNPLAGIKLLVEAARRPQNPQPLDSEDLRVIHRELGRVEQTVQGLLDYARLPAPNRVRCDLRDVVAPAMEFVRPRADQRRIALSLLDPGQPSVTDIDQDQVYRVLVNLLLNATDACADGGRVEVAWMPTAGGAVRVKVSDTGTGIPPEIEAKLFTPFATTKPTGTGLGLSLSARIVEEHGGTITAQNRPEGGACFTVVLPEPSLEARP